jgi:hypothetical protein
MKMKWKKPLSGKKETEKIDQVKLVLPRVTELEIKWK